MKVLWVFSLGGVLVLSACGGGKSTSQSQNSGPLAGNWQFTMASPADNSFVGGMRGGFLQQNKGSMNGEVVYSIDLPQGSGVPPILCNSGSAPVTGTVSGQSVTLTAIAGTQTFTLTGTLSADGSTMMGTYASTDGKGCGTAQTGLQWSAISVPPLTGTIQGNFHSSSSSSQQLANQDFLLSGSLTQGANIGASNATITGTLNFQGYPCLDTASVNGQISGNSVILQIIASDGLTVGQIGAPAGTPNLAPVAFENLASGGGYVLHGTSGYELSTKKCPQLSGLPGDLGNVCLGLGNATGCTQPISLSPASLTFAAQALGSSTAQMLTLTNSSPSGSTLTGLTLALSANTSSFGPSDFTGLANFNELDNCAPSLGSPFSLAPQQSCSITIGFSPQESCPWLPLGSPPSASGAPPSMCPFPLAATLTVQSPSSADADTLFAVPITGIGFSAIVPSTPELDFGSEAVSETSSPQLLIFTNQGQGPVQILSALSTPCISGNLPPRTPGAVSGFQVVTGSISANVSTVNYICDTDPVSNQPNFQISADTCSGRVLFPEASCSLQISFVPQPATPLNPALDYFLQLNTLQCTSSTTSNCEIDSGRFPVELKANTPSPLRMSPGAGLDFGAQSVGHVANPLTITLFNDPSIPNPAPVNFTGNLVKGDYTETDDCPTSLAPGSSCTLTVIFKPQSVGFDPGTITITYTVGQTQTVYLRGTGQ
jgi:hypothetical protein